MTWKKPLFHVVKSVKRSRRTTSFHYYVGHYFLCGLLPYRCGKTWRASCSAITMEEAMVKVHLRLDPPPNLSRPPRPRSRSTQGHEEEVTSLFRVRPRPPPPPRRHRPAPRPEMVVVETSSFSIMTPHQPRQHNRAHFHPWRRPDVQSRSRWTITTKRPAEMITITRPRYITKGREEVEATGTTTWTSTPTTIHPHHPHHRKSEWSTTSINHCTIPTTTTKGAVAKGVEPLGEPFKTRTSQSTPLPGVGIISPVPQGITTTTITITPSTPDQNTIRKTTPLPGWRVTSPSANTHPRQVLNNSSSSSTTLHPSPLRRHPPAWTTPPPRPRPLSTLISTSTSKGAISTRGFIQVGS